MLMATVIQLKANIGNIQVDLALTFVKILTSQIPTKIVKPILPIEPTKENKNLNRKH